MLSGFLKKLAKATSGAVKEISKEKTNRAKVIRRQYPILRPNMIAPVDAILTTAEVKKAFREYLKQTKYCDYSEELNYETELFLSAMKEEEESIKIEIQQNKENIEDEKEEIKNFKIKLKNCDDDDERESLSDDIESCLDSIKFYEGHLDKHQKKLDEFKSNKREFVVVYVNNKLQMPGWENLI